MFRKFLNNLLPKLKREILLIRPFRRLIFYFLEKKLYQDIVEKKDPNWVSHNFPRKAREDNFFITLALVRTVDRALSRNLISKRAFRQTYDFVAAHLPKEKESPKSSFFKKYGMKPPALLALSPTKLCNLKCLGCYSDSSAQNRQKLPFEIFSRIVREQKKLWGSHLTVITGGEPFLYNDGGKTILDLAAEHPDTFFLVYTNGTLIDEKIAGNLASLGNITPAISVEGFEKETDERRGSGIHQKIIRAFGCLKKSGVPFGISVTPTRKNAELITSGEFIDYYFEKCGAANGWIFQYLPVGRDCDFDLMMAPEQRIAMFRKTWSLIKERKIPFIDFWNCGSVIGGCMAGGRPHGYMHIEWNGNVTPCVFYNYASQNIAEIYKQGGDLNSVLFSPFFEKIRQWQNDYIFDKPAGKMGDMIACCPIRDHHKIIPRFHEGTGARAINESAGKNLEDEDFREGLAGYGEKFKTISGEIWNKEYLAPERKSGLGQNGGADN